MYVPLYVPLRPEPGGCELVRVRVIEPEVTRCAPKEIEIDVALTADVKETAPPSGGNRVPLKFPPETVPLTGSNAVKVFRGVHVEPSVSVRSFRITAP